MQIHTSVKCLGLLGLIGACASFSPLYAQDISINYSADLLQNTSGGIKRSGAYVDLLYLSVDHSIKASSNWALNGHASLIYTNGNDFSSNIDNICDNQFGVMLSKGGSQVSFDDNGKWTGVGLKIGRGLNVGITRELPLIGVKMDKDLNFSCTGSEC